MAEAACRGGRHIRRLPANAITQIFGFRCLDSKLKPYINQPIHGKPFK